MSTFVRFLVVAGSHKALLASALVLAPVLWDTSSRLVAPMADVPLSQPTSRLLTWDMLYYVTAAQRGQQFEHEYAFSRYWSALIAQFALGTDAVSLAQCAAVLSIVSHLAAVLLLYAIARSFGVPQPMLPATLYSLSPAGIFLVAGYPESVFAALSFLGVLLFYAYRWYLAAGLVFGAATLFRANGLVWGALFFVQILEELATLARQRSRPLRRARNIASLVTGGCLIAAVFVYTQVDAYARFCPGLDFCGDRVPSIYLHIQQKYWSNGFLAYWTPNNIPNFLFGAPTLYLLLQSTAYLARQRRHGLALVQAAMLVGALFFWNVQIITRVASCLPGVYLYVANLHASGRRRAGRAWLAYFAVWSVAQAVLYGAFMPPA